MEEGIMNAWRYASAALLAAFLLLETSDFAAAQTGSFARTCQRCYGNGRGTITCLCLTINRQWVWTSAYYAGCPRYSLTNVNGRLVCGS
jgi:hypothetical protein